MSSRAMPLVLVFALAVPFSAAIAAPAAAAPSGSPFDFIPAETLESPKQVRDDGAVLVEVTAVDADALAAVEAAVGAMAEIVTVAADFGVVVAWAQPEAIDAITAMSEVRSVIAPPPPANGGLSLTAPMPVDWITAPQCRSVPVESDGPLQSAIARAEGGVDGTGVTVGVISDSFDVSEEAATTFDDDVALGALPGPGNPCGYETPLTVVDDAEEGSDEGRAMAQLVHGIAPGARLLFATGFPSAYVMADNIRALVDEGADIIVDDLSFFSEPIAQAGVVADAIAYARSQGVAYFSSAGNGSIVSDDGTQIGGWASSSFTTATCPAIVTDPTIRCLDFGLDTPDSTNRITLQRNDEGLIDFSVWTRWSQPWYGVDAPIGMALLTTDPVNPQVIASSLCSDATQTAPNVCSQPWSAAGVGSSTTGLPADDTIELDLVVFTDADPSVLAGISVASTLRTSKGSIVALEHDEGGTGQGRDVTVGATLTVNNAAQGVFAVGAADVAHADELENFSSWGETTWLWQSVSSEDVGVPAEPLGEPWVRLGVDAVGIDGAITTFFGGGNRFFGTSAAAPTVAAVAALLLQAVPGITDAELDDALRDSADPSIVGPDGVDPVTAIGAGLVDANAALTAAGADPNPLAAPVPAPIVPEDTAALVSAQSAGGLPELVATVADGVATVRSLPAELEGWTWVYGYSTPSDRGWRPVVGGVMTLSVAGWSQGQHHLALFRGDELVATALVAIPTPGSKTLPGTGAAIGSGPGLGAGLLAAGGLLLGGLVVVRRRARAL